MLTGDKKLAKDGMRACEQFARSRGVDIAEDQGAVMQDLVISILHLCDQEGMDADWFLRKASKKFYDTLVEEDY